MNIKKSVFYRSFAESYRKFADLAYMAESFASDLTFFALFAVVYTFYFNPRIVAILNSVNTLVSQMNINIPSDNSIPTGEAMAALAAQKDAFMQHFTSLVMLFLLLALFVYALWCIFQGTDWWLVHKKLKNRVSWCKYQQRFSIVSFLWAVVFFIIYYLLIKFSSVSSIGNIELIDVSLLAKLLGIVLVIILYFAFVSYSLLHRELKQALKGIYSAGIKKASAVVPAFLLILIKFFVLFKLLMLLMLGLFYTGILGLILFIPLAAWSRLLMGIVAKNSGK